MTAEYDEFYSRNLDESCTCGHIRGEHWADAREGCSHSKCACTSYRSAVLCPVTVDDDFDRLFEPREG